MQCPAFCSQLLRSGSWFVAFLYPTVHNCPDCSSVLVSFTVSLMLQVGGDLRPGLSLADMDACGRGAARWVPW